MADITKNSVGIVKTQTVRLIEADAPLILQSGKTLAPVDVAYETYGRLNDQADNAVLICHALSGSAHAAGFNDLSEEKPGWWDNQIGPGKAIDTNKYFVICSNFLGSCSGTTGPGSINPATQKPYGLDFPVITISDMVRVQKLLLDKLGIKKLLAVTGGSMGGMQTLQWAVQYPDFVKAVIPIATTTRLGAQAIAFDAVGRNAILADPDFADGQSMNKKGANSGLSIARMVGHITYLSEQGMHEKFGRKLKTAKDYRYEFNSEFSVETYLDHQGQTFVERFDPYSYLYLTKAMDYFDLEKDYGSLNKAFANTNSKFLVISFTSDWLFTPGQSKAIVDALVANRKEVSYCNINAPYGHDSFLLEPKTLGTFLSAFLEMTHKPEIKKTSATASAQNSLTFSRFEQAKRSRVDYELIESMILPQSTVLDVGCGDGQLLANLVADKNIKAEGVELEQDMILRCVEKGLPVIQQDIGMGLENYADKSFDYVILSQTVQTVKDPQKVFTDMLRVGKKVVVSFPNFAHLRCRIQLMFSGKAPVSKHLPFSWHDSPNIHFMSIKDFDQFCARHGVKVEKKIPLKKNYVSGVKFAPNFFAEQVIYVTSKD